MVKFFRRIERLHLNGTTYKYPAPSPHSDDVERLLDAMRQCPSYQINSFHSHCGLRARLLPLLDLLQRYLSLDAGNTEVGICLDCWNNHRYEYAWLNVKRPLQWSPSNRLVHPTSPYELAERNRNACLARHLATSEIFLAKEKIWEPDQHR